MPEPRYEPAVTEWDLAEFIKDLGKPRGAVKILHSMVPGGYPTVLAAIKRKLVTVKAKGQDAHTYELTDKGVVEYWDLLHNENPNAQIPMYKWQKK